MNYPSVSIVKINIVTMVPMNSNDSSQLLISLYICSNLFMCCGGFFAFACIKFGHSKWI